MCFVVHNHAEEVATSMRQRQEEAGSASKVNCYEVAMVAKTAEYLMLQGYEPDQVKKGEGRASRRTTVFCFIVNNKGHVSLVPLQINSAD